MSSTLTLPSQLLQEIKGTTKQTSNTTDTAVDTARVVILTKTHDLSQKIQNVAFHAFITKKRECDIETFIKVKDLRKVKPEEKQLIEKLHKQALNYLSNYNRNVLNQIPTNTFLIPKDIAKEIHDMFKTLNDSDMKVITEYLKEDISEEERKLPPQEFVNAVNANLGVTDRKNIYLDAARERVENLFNSSFNDSTHLYPLEKELSNRRSYLLPLFEVNDPDIKEIVLERYVALCEADPISDNTLHDLVDNLKKLVKWHQEGYYNSLKPKLFVLSVKSIALTLECLTLQLAKEQLSGQQEEVKQDAIKVSRAFKDLNIHEIPEVRYWSAYALFASHSIQTDATILSKGLSVVVDVAGLGCSLADAVINKSPAATAEFISKAADAINKVYEQIDMGGDWFKTALSTKRANRIAIYKLSLYLNILPILRNPKATQTTSVSEPDMDVNPQPHNEDAAVINIDPIQSTFFQLFSILENLELAILYSPDERVCVEAFKLLLHNLFSDNALTVEKTVQTVMNIATKGNEKAKNTAHIILEICLKGDFLENVKNAKFLSSLTQFISSKKSDLILIKEKTDYHSQVIKGLMNQALELRRDDNSGICLINLLAYSTEPIGEFLAVFSQIPAIKEEIYDYKGNTIYHLAASLGNDALIQTVKMSFKEIIPVNSANKEGDFPIHIATKYCHDTVFNALLSVGADPTKKNALGCTALHLAVQQRPQKSLQEHLGAVTEKVEAKERGLSIIRKLCTKSPLAININEHDRNGKTPLNYAILNSDLEAIKILEQAGGKIAEEKVLISPLLIAIKPENWQVIIYYLDKQTPSYAEMGKIFQLISSNGETLNNNVHPTFLKYIVNKIQNDKQFRESFTAFYSAPHPRADKKEGEASIKDIIQIEKAIPAPIAAVLRKDYSSALTGALDSTDTLGCTLLMYLAMDLSDDAFQTAKKLIWESCDINIKNKLEANATLVACLNKNLRLLQVFSENSADFNTSCSLKFYPTHIAAYMKNLEMIHFFHHKVEFDQKNQFMETPLHLFCGADPRTTPSLLSLSPMIPSTIERNEISDEEEVGILEILATPSIINEQDCFGNTCLHRAVLFGKACVIEYLLKKHSQLFWIKNAQGLLPIQMLKKNENERDEKKIAAFNFAPLDLDQETFDSPGLTTTHLAASMKLLPHLTRLLQKNINGALNKNSMTGETPLHVGAKEGFDSMIDLYSKSNVNLEPLDNLRNTPLHTACLHGQLKFVETYLKYCSKCTSKENIDGRQPIHLAAINGNLAIVKKLISKRASTSIPDIYGELPIHLAAKYGHSELVAYLYGLNPKDANRKNDEGLNTLHIASMMGHENVIATLLTRGNKEQADLTLQMISEEKWYLKKPSLTLIHQSTPIEDMTGIVQPDRRSLSTQIDPPGPRKQSTPMASHKPSVKFSPSQDLSPSGTLIEEPTSDWNLPLNEVVPDVLDHSGLTALLHASSRGHWKSVRVLLSLGSESRVTNGLGETSLHLAVHGLHEQVVYDLLAYDKTHINSESLNLSSVIDSQGDCVITELFKQKPNSNFMLSEKRKRILMALIQEGCPVNTQDKSGNTPLHWGMKNGLVELSAELIRLSYNAFSNSRRPHFQNSHFLVSMEVKNHLGNTPLHEAAIAGNVSGIKFMCSGHTFAQAKETHPPIRHALSKNMKNEAGETPLWLAVEKGHYEAFMELLENRGNIRTRDKRGRTLYHLIYSQTPLNEGHKKILSQLRQQWPMGVYKADASGRTCLHVIAETGTAAHSKAEEMKDLLCNLPSTSAERVRFYRKKTKKGKKTAKELVTETNSILKQSFNMFLLEDLGSAYDRRQVVGGMHSLISLRSSQNGHSHPIA